jgi:two-component system chemotaxis sensor kinase CheA
MDMSQYLNVFMDECNEHLLALNQSLLELEHDPENSVVLDRFFRAAHTLKGASGTMGFNKMATLTHAMEDVLSRLRSKELLATPEIINVLFESVDLLEILTKRISEGKEEDIEIAGVIQDLRKFAEGDKSIQSAERRFSLQLRYLESERQQIIEAQPEGAKFYHIDITLSPGCLLKGARVFMVLREIEKWGSIIRSAPSLKELEDENFELRFIIGALSSNPPAELESAVVNIMDIDKIQIDEVDPDAMQIEKRVQDFAERGEKYKIGAIQTVRVDIKKLDDLMNLVAEMVINRSRLESLGAHIESKDLQDVIGQVGRLTMDLRDNVLKARMVQVDTVFSRFPRLVRDLAKDLNKEIDLEIHGGETELDRTVIDEIADPLIHIIRNAIDHGIETTAERQKVGKSERGLLILRAYQEGNNVVINVSDDGKGFDLKKVKEKALKQGLVNTERASELREDEILGFTFLPGFSTADQVTDVSGRGVGMDVVKTKIDSLGGMIHIDSEPGEGTTLSIRLPLTLAIIQTLMVQLGKEIYAIPSGYVDQITSLRSKEIKHIRKQEVFMLRGEVLPLIRLQHVLETPGAINPDLDELDVVVLRLGDRLVGCVVDLLLRQQDVVIKSLGRFLSSIKGIAGATILGDGRVALILDLRSVA